MRCNICNKTLSEPVFNRELGAWEPCDECLEVIQDTLSAFYDRPSAAEDELVDPPSEIPNDSSGLYENS